MGALRSALLLIPLAALAAGRPEGLGFDSTASNALETAASIYIAPENEFIYRMRFPDGSYREFQRTVSDSASPLQKLWSPGDWKGGLRAKERLIYVESSTNVVGGRALFLFRNGRLVTFEQNGRVGKIPYEAPRPTTAGGAPYYFGDGESEDEALDSGGKRKEQGLAKDVQRELKKKWAKSGRLRWPFENPNENGFLYLSIALLATALFYIPRRGAKIAGGVCFVAASAALVMTASRGSFIAFALGLAPAVALNFKKVVKSRALWVLAGAVLLVAGVWAVRHPELFTRGFVKKSRWSNETRLEMWATAPQMIAEAPNGWDGLRVNPKYMVGRAYVDWYDSLSQISLSGSLVNDHLTRLVGYSRIGRYTYLFIWFGLLALTAYTAARTKRAVALGVFVALAVAGWFNAVLMNAFLWGVPVAGLGLFLAGRPWRVWRSRTVGLLVGGSAVLAVCVLEGIAAYGRATVKRDYAIRVGDGQVRVKGDSPGIWIVDDGKALGGVMSCRDIRRRYLNHPSSPAVGYVRHVDDLPREKIARLVLAGDMGRTWFEGLQKAAEKGEDVTQFIPQELVLITPSFPPSELPEEVVKACKVTYVIGEFVARYDAEEFVNPPAWVSVVPGMELYVDDWMRFAVE